MATPPHRSLRSRPRVFLLSALGPLPIWRKMSNIVRSDLDDVQELTPEAIASMVDRTPWQSEMDAIAEELVAPRNDSYRYYQPLSQATDDFVFQANTINDRIYTGVDTFDTAMRGLGPKQLMLVQGYTHSGKTLFTTNMLRFNKNRRIAMFTPDEDRVSILLKMVAIEHGVSAVDLEYRISQGDKDAIALIRSTAEVDYPNLAVFEDVNDLQTMTRAMEETCDAWSAAADLVIFDFVDLLTNGGDISEGATAHKINSIKAWGRQQAPMMALHQTSRSSGADGAEMTISSGAYGGESAATYLIGVRRKRDYWGGVVRELEERKRRSSKWGNQDQERLEDARYELKAHRDTVTFNLLKNKRPPGGLVDEADFKLDAETGRISTIEKSFMPSSTLGAAQRALQRQEEMF